MGVLAGKRCTFPQFFPLTHALFGLLFACTKSSFYRRRLDMTFLLLASHSEANAEFFMSSRDAHSYEIMESTIPVA